MANTGCSVAIYNRFVYDLTNYINPRLEWRLLLDSNRLLALTR
jgi:hypothetical protein